MDWTRKETRAELGGHSITETLLLWVTVGLRTDGDLH